MKYKVRFIKEGKLERAFPKQEQRGGFWLETIPIGTFMELRPSQLRFWQARDCVEIVERINSPLKQRIAAEPISQRVESIEERSELVENQLEELSEPVENRPEVIEAPLEQTRAVTKAPIQRMLAAAQIALNQGDIISLRTAFSSLESGDRVMHPDIPEDMRERLFFIVEDAISGADLTDYLENLGDFIASVLYELLPPSQKEKYQRNAVS